MHAPQQSTAQPSASQPAGSLQAAREDWERMARYRVTLSRTGNWNESITIAEWLTLSEAEAWCARENAALVANHPEVRSWSGARYSYQLISPPIQAGHRAQVGDLLFHQKDEGDDDCNTLEAYTWRRYFLPAIVTSADSGGYITGFRDRDGLHTTRASKPHVVSSVALDVSGFLYAIALEEARRGHWGGEFGQVSAAMPWLVRHQHLQAGRYGCATAEQIQRQILGVAEVH